MLALSSVVSALAFYWLLLLLVTQRGPVMPCNQEITEPVNENLRTRGLALLGLPFLVLLPWPAELIAALRDMANPAPLGFY
jgi:hypothetical protein